MGKKRLELSQCKADKVHETGSFDGDHPTTSPTVSGSHFLDHPSPFLILFPIGIFSWSEVLMDTQSPKGHRLS